MRTAFALTGALLALLLAACGGDDGGGDGDGAEAAGTAPARATASSGPCRDVPLPEPRPEGTLEAPTAILDAGTEHRLRFVTSCGDFTVTLAPELSPRAASSFRSLAARDFFDDTVFHRIVPGFVIQGGDPTATGAGGPGYSTVDVPAGDTTYPKGAVAMAKAGADPPGTAGSQFFVVTADGIQLPPDYALVGYVTEGMEVVDRIAVLGDPATELPTRPVVVEDVVVEPA